MPTQASTDRRKKIAMRLARIEGQVRAVRARVEDGASCEAIATQMTAARHALDRAFFDMLACSLLNQVETKPSAAAVRASTDELARLLVKFA